jgi:hypothetical protein
VLQGEDPATHLVKKKLLWKHQVAVYKRYYKTQKKRKQLQTALENILFVVDFLFTSRCLMGAWGSIVVKAQRC